MLDLWVKYWLNYLKDPRNEFIDPKSLRKYKSHNYLAKIKHLINIYLMTFDDF